MTDHTGEKSRITILNETRRIVWVAIYRRPPSRPGETAVAWAVAAAPPRGKSVIPVPGNYQIFARYSFEPEDPLKPVYQSRTLSLKTPAGGFAVDAISLDRRTWGAVLNRLSDGPGWGRIRVVNRFGIGVWSHVQQDGRDIYPPRVLPPDMAWMEDLRSPFYLAVLRGPVQAGDRLLDEEITLSEVELDRGGTAAVRGGPRKGYEILTPAPQGGKLKPEKHPVDLPDELEARAPQPSPRPKASQRTAKASPKPPKKPRRARPTE
jgi:hypothetical protein